MRYRIGELVNSVSDKFDFSGKNEISFLNTGDILENRLFEKRKIAI